MDWRADKAQGACEPCGAVIGACLRGKGIAAGGPKGRRGTARRAIDKSYSLDFLNPQTVRVG